MFHKYLLGILTYHSSLQCTEVRFASFLSGGFTTMAVMNPPENKLEKRTYSSLNICKQGPFQASSSWHQLKDFFFINWKNTVSKKNRKMDQILWPSEFLSLPNCLQSKDFGKKGPLVWPSCDSTAKVWLVWAVASQSNVPQCQCLLESNCANSLHLADLLTPS